MSNWLKKLNLQSPFWQGTGAIVSIVALVISTFIAYDIYQKSLRLPDLTIMYQHSFNPINFGESSSKNIAMSIDGEIVSELEIYSYTLENSGKAPIVPDDYIEPISVSVKEPLRILTIEKYRSYPDDLALSWNEISENRFQLEPLLLNPGDSIRVLVFVSESSKEIEEASQLEASYSNGLSNTNNDEFDSVALQEDSKKEPIWAARIVNISDLNVTTYEEVYETEAKTLGIFYGNLRHSGWSVYRFVLVSCILFLFGLSLGINFGVLQQASTLYYILISILMILSIAAGDNLSSRINDWPQTPLSNLSVLSYCLLIVVFTFPALKRIVARLSSVR